MAVEIAPTRAEEVEELGRFLVEGFGAPPDAEFAAPDVLRWKYFEPRVGIEVPRSLVARDGGRIVGHLGFFPTAFLVRGEADREVSTMHMVDWLASPTHPGLGIRMVFRANRSAETHYGFGGTLAARRVGQGRYFEQLPGVPVFRKVLRFGHALRESGPLRGGLRAARDVALAARQRGRPPRATIDLARVASFGPETDAVLDACERPLVLTDRRSPTLNYYLRYPRGGITGWRLSSGGEALGFAVLNVVRRGPTRAGKVVDGFLAARDPDLWHAAMAALADEVRGQGADVVEACGSTPWAASALVAAGFRRMHALDFQFRDTKGLVPRQGPFHVGFLEADYAFS